MLVVLHKEVGAPVVRVLPVTHSPPASAEDGIEIPLPTKRRLGLDSDRSWIVLTEANDFIWPGPDLRPTKKGDLSSVAYGMLPPGLMKVLRERIIERWRREHPSATRREQ